MGIFQKALRFFIGSNTSKTCSDPRYDERSWVDAYEGEPDLYTPVQFTDALHTPLKNPDLSPLWRFGDAHATGRASRHPVASGG